MSFKVINKISLLWCTVEQTILLTYYNYTEILFCKTIIRVNKNIFEKKKQK